MDTVDYAGFVRAVEQTMKDVPQTHRDLQVKLAADALQYLTEISPVVTGAYNASHTIDIGDAESASAVYWGPEIPDPDQVITPGSRPILEPPSGRAAEAALTDIAPFQRLQLHNRRFYAESVENRHSVYAIAEAVANNDADRIAASTTTFETLRKRSYRK